MAHMAASRTVAYIFIDDTFAVNCIHRESSEAYTGILNAPSQIYAST